MLPLDQFAVKAVSRGVILFMITFIMACSKEPAANLTGYWKIEKQLTAHYSGFEKTSEDVSELCSAYMLFNSNGTGSLTNLTTVVSFNYVVSADELILSTASCKCSTWYIAENTGDYLVMEHSHPSMVTVRYLRKID